MPRPLRFAMLGTGFWSRFQLAGWKQVGNAECVALYNRTAAKAKELGELCAFAPRIYDDPRELLCREQLDFVDIVTNIETHSQLVHLAAEHRVPMICQKPMATSLEEARAMVAVCERAHVPFFIHENWRWQTPIRKLKEILASGAIGTVYRARLRMASSFPVFENQPFLKTLEKFLLMDMGSHLLDVARFLFGEATSVYCTMTRVQQDIKGEDAATVVLKTASGATVVCEMAYAGTPMEHDRFPHTFAFLEGDGGSIELGADYWLRVTTRQGVQAVHAPPPKYAWADPCYEVVHASIVPCHLDLLKGLNGNGMPETTAEDNLHTVRLVFSAYESATTNEVIVW